MSLLTIIWRSPFAAASDSSCFTVKIPMTKIPPKNICDKNPTVVSYLTSDVVFYHQHFNS
jgi:hypothetical protein